MPRLLLFQRMKDGDTKEYVVITEELEDPMDYAEPGYQCVATAILSNVNLSLFPLDEPLRKSG